MKKLIIVMAILLTSCVEKKMNDLEKQVQQQNININHNIHITIEDESW